MLKSILYFSLLIFSMSVYSAPVKELTQADIIKTKIEYELNASEVLDLLRTCNVGIVNGRKSGKPMPIIKYLGYSAKLDSWLEYRWFTADTELSKEWLKSVNELIVYMRKTQDFIEKAKYNNTTHKPAYAKAVKYYDIAYKRFIEAIQKPVKVQLKFVRQAKLQKSLWQRQMRKKYNIK